MGISDIMNAAKAFNLTDEQKAAVKKVASEASGNKDTIATELKKHGINVTADQVDMVLKMAEKL